MDCKDPTPAKAPQISNFNAMISQTAQENLASNFAKILAQEIQDFDNSLGEEFEVGLKLVSFGQTIVFAVHDISYHDPSLIEFDGVAEDGSPIKLIQNVTQISFLLTSLCRKQPEEPKRRIGFLDKY